VSAAATRALGLALLDATAAPVAVVGRGAGPWVAALRAAGRPVAETGPAGAAVVTFVGERAAAAVRTSRLAAVRARLAPGAPVLLVDHAQPRPWWRRPGTVVRLLARGLPPSRGRYLAARELDAAGFRVERLRLAAGERVQLVLARRDA
jgi:hypothetical protein